MSGQDLWRIRQAGVLFGSIPPDLQLYTLMLEDAADHVGYTGKGWAPGDWGDHGLQRNPVGREYNNRMEGTVALGIDKRNYSANFEDFLADRPEGKPFCFWFGSTEPHRIYQDGAGLMVGKNPDLVDVPSFWPDVDIVRSDILDY